MDETPEVNGDLILDQVSSGNPEKLLQALILIIIIVLTDLFDGIAARYSKQITNFGKLIDPVADKISLMVVIIYLIFTYGLPFLIFFVVLSIRDIFLIIIGIYLIISQGEVFQSNQSGKWFIGIFSATMAAFLFQISFCLQWLLYFLSVILFIISTYNYIKRYLKYFKSLENE